MNKFLLSLLSALAIIPAMRAQNPDAIYIASWTTMQELGKAITPSDSDPKLSYNAETGCYEGAVIDWPRTQGNPYNAKIPYSVEGDEITYYGVAGASQIMVFNSNDSETYRFSASTNPSSFKGWVISTANANALEDIKISMNLTTSSITFTTFDSGEGTELPQLVSITPENGSQISLNEDGGTTIVLVFDGKVDSMEIIGEEGRVTPEVSDNGEVWTLPVSAQVVESSMNENQGRLILKIQKVYANGLPVSFEGGKDFLELVYTVAGISKTTTLEFTGNESGLATLNVYRSPYYSVGDQIDFEGNTIGLTYTKSLTYLFTVGNDYSVEITSTVDSNDGENWKLGEGYSTEKGENGETTNIPAVQGVTLTINEGADGAVFTIRVVGKDDAGVESILMDGGINKIYTIDGNKVNSLDVNTLSPGLYIINGRKVLVK